MPYQIDQSGKIEQTNKNTVLAISNGKQLTLLLRAKDKRLLQELFRSLFNKQRQYIYEVFSALLFIILVKANPQSKIVIDKEYPGQEALIRLLVLKFYADNNQVAPANIEFGLVGKSSKVHNLGYKVFKKKTKPSLIITFDEIMEIIFPEKKIGYSSINGTEGS